MDYGLTLVTAPAAEPVSLTQAKAHLRVDHTSDDTLITEHITAARLQAEHTTKRQLITATYDLWLNTFPRGSQLVLPKPALQSVTTLKYTDYAGAETTWASSNYHVDATRVHGSLVLAYGISWPSVTLRTVNGIAVRFVAGYGAAADVPQDIKNAMLLLIGHYYENREGVVGTPGVTLNPHELPMGVLALLMPYWAGGF